MATDIPDFVTHYYRACRAPFLNLSELSEESVDEVIERLTAERAIGQSSRVFGRRYMELRRLTEEKLRRLFMQAGGVAHRLSPHYFVLGSSPWYEGLAADMAQVRIPLSDLPDDASSFTIPDSFTAMGLGEAFGLRVHARPYHDKIYRLSELSEVITRYGMPVDDPGDYQDYQHNRFEKYVEVQLWVDEPVARFD